MLLPVLFVVFLVSLASVNGSLQISQMNAGCGFHLVATGNFNGSVGQLPNGQVRAGSDLSPTLFTWFGDAFADQQGRSCWWTLSAPTAVLQCDWNQQPSHGFGIGCYGGVSYRDQSSFYICQTGDGDEVNIYLEPNGGNCEKVMLHADGCHPPCVGKSSSSYPSDGTTTPGPNLTPAPVQASTSTTTQDHLHTLASTTSDSKSGSPTSTSTPVPGYCDVVVAQGPDDIILVDRANPDTSFGPNPDLRVQLSPNVSAIFVFHFSAVDKGKMCALAFDLPLIETSIVAATSISTQRQRQQKGPEPPYRLAETGPVRFLLLDGPPKDSDRTTWDNAPRVTMLLEAVMLTPGISVQPLAFPCPGAEGDITVEIRDEPGSDACLEYEQRHPQKLVGMYLLRC